MSFAKCVYHCIGAEAAMKIFQHCLNDESTIQEQEVRRDLYRCLSLYYFDKEQYKEAILYSAKEIDLYNFGEDEWCLLIGRLATLHVLNEQSFLIEGVVKSYINKYLTFLEIKSTDCWTREYQDKILGDLYYDIAQYGSSSDSEKYFIISAAWGNPKAIEICKQYEIDYSIKPYQYEY